MYHIFEQACVNITTTLSIGNACRSPEVVEGRLLHLFALLAKEKQDATHTWTPESVYLLTASKRLFAPFSPKLVRKVKWGSQVGFLTVRHSLVRLTDLNPAQRASRRRGRPPPCGASPSQASGSQPSTKHSSNSPLTSHRTSILGSPSP